MDGPKAADVADAVVAAMQALRIPTSRGVLAVRTVVRTSASDWPLSLSATFATEDGTVRQLTLEDEPSPPGDLTVAEFAEQIVNVLIALIVEDVETDPNLRR